MNQKTVARNGMERGSTERDTKPPIDLTEPQGNIETHKPHITRLPVVAYPDYEITDTEVAVSIALFHSAIDSATLSGANSQRLKDVHAKGAVWAAMSLIRNTDLSERGVGIYFHVEAAIYDVVSEVFEEFQVPEKFIRRMDIAFPKSDKVKHPHYGKKFMCLEDTIETERWLIADSDAFVCTAGDKFQWYDKLKAFENPSAIKSFMGDYKGDQFRIWVHGVCLAAGIPFFPDEDLFGQELRCFYTLEHWLTNRRPINPKYETDRPVISTQFFMLPVQHRLAAHIKKFYKTCYQDEFLIAMWESAHQEVSDLRKKLGSFHFYNYESEFIARDKTLDKAGYVAHIVPDDHGPEQKNVDAYYDDFYKALTFYEPPQQTNSESISDKLIGTRSDKQHPKGHQYGKFYDMIFESMAFRKKRSLRVLEIGVSLFGQGSMEAFQASELVEQVVGLDLITYVGELNEKSAFHKIDAYKPATLMFLKEEYPDGFDIIIDDCTHKSEHQRFFFEHYLQLLCEGGKLICEDVINRDFFEEMCNAGECYGIDGWANANKALDEEHMERILIKDRPKVLPVSAVQSGVDEFNFYTPPVRKTFFVLEVPYATGKEDFACAFVQRIFKWCRAMINLGHKIIYLGHANSTVDCTEHVTVYDDAVLDETYGSHDYFVVPEHDMNDHAFKTFRQNAEIEIRKRAQADDFVLAFYGLGHLELCEALSDLPVHIVEPSIGYPDAFSENRVYQSSPKMHFERGKADANYFIAEKYPDCEYNEFLSSQYNRMQYTVPDRNSVVIPNFFDFDHFEYKEKKDDYICFVGRINICKGLHDVFQLAKYTNTRLIAAGVGRLEQCGLDIPPQLEFVGVADIATRSDIYANAMAHVCPSIYLEPFLGSGVESLFCGTAHITSNWGAPMDWVIDGKTGWRTQNFDHMVWCLENIDQVSPKDCRHQAVQYSKERVSLMYHEYFNILLQNKRGGRWSVNPERKQLDWLYSDMTEAEIQVQITEIQNAIAGEGK